MPSKSGVTGCSRPDIGAFFASFTRLNKKIISETLCRSEMRASQQAEVPAQANRRSEWLWASWGFRGEAKSTFGFLGVDKVFSALAQRADLPRESLPALEFMYLPMLRTDNLAIHELLLEQPAFFMGVVSRVFRAKDEEPRIFPKRTGSWHPLLIGYSRG